LNFSIDAKHQLPILTPYGRAGAELFFVRVSHNSLPDHAPNSAFHPQKQKDASIFSARFLCPIDCHRLDASLGNAKQKEEIAWQTN
jgi:hypothetical protein